MFQTFINSTLKTWQMGNAAHSVLCEGWPVENTCMTA